MVNNEDNWLIRAQSLGLVKFQVASPQRVKVLSSNWDCQKCVCANGPNEIEISGPFLKIMGQPNIYMGHFNM